MSNFLHLRKNIDRVICWRTLDENDKEPAVYFIKNFFIKNAPICQGTKLSEDETSCLIDYTVDCLKNRHSICAYDNDSAEILGMSIISGPQRVSDAKFLDLGPVPTQKQKQIGRALAKLALGIPAEIKDDMCMKSEFLVTHPKYAQWGIASALAERALVLAREQGCKRFLAESSSCFSARLREKLGAVCLHQIRYVDYVDSVTGERIFSDVSPPHDALRLMCHNL